MSDSSQSILVIDSGVGGVAILNSLIQKLPDEHFIYFADYAFLPYGEKNAKDIQQRLDLLVCYFLNQFSIKAVVLACNSATAAAISHLREKYKLEFFGIEPGIKPAAAKAKIGVAVLATKLTLASEPFKTLISTYAQGTKVYSLPAPELVDLVENGYPSSEVVKTVLEKITGEFDVLLLGCTHFCFLKQEFENILGDRVVIVDTSEPVAKRVADKLGQQKLLNTSVISDKNDLLITYSLPTKNINASSFTQLQQQLIVRLEKNNELVRFKQIEIQGD